MTIKRDIPNREHLSAFMNTLQHSNSQPLFSLRKQFDLSPCNTDHDGHSYWFIFSNNGIHLRKIESGCTIPDSPEIPFPRTGIIHRECIGIYEGTPCIALNIADTIVPDQYEIFSLRQAHAHLEGDLWVIAGRASQILQWRKDNRFCGRCGHSMTRLVNEFALTCNSCEYTAHPRISPAVIMSVTKGDEILLGRSPHFPEGMYSTLAGFVEAGETLEEAVIREIREETSIEVTNVRYIASQPWPFPHSLMVGFTAEYAGGEIVVDAREIEDAGWFKPTNMPKLPSRLSIARKLIELFLAEY